MGQYSKFDRIVEARDHFKNGASSKSRMNRGNLMIAIVATMMVCLTISGCKKENIENESGTIKYGTKVFNVSIGEIGKNRDNGDIWIELVPVTGNLEAELKIVQEKVLPPLGMRIMVSGKTLEYDVISISESRYWFGFKTGKKPEKIIVYSNDGSNATLTFDGKSRRVK